MGDEVAMTAAVREAKRQRPDEMIRISGRLNREIWLNCPYTNIGNEEDGKLTRVWSFYRDHVGSRTQLYFKLLGLDPSMIEDELPELWWTAEELASPIMVKKSHRKMEKEFVALEEALCGVRAPIVAVDPGAGWATRKWPEEKYYQLTGKLAARGFAVVLVGSRPRGELPGIAVDLVNRLSLRALARFLGRCALFVGNDSGLFHLSAAVGTPHVTIYGPTRKTCGPYATTIAVEPEAVCPSKCFEFCGRTLAGDETGTIRHCMEEISVDRVLDAIDEALARPRPASRLVPCLTRAQAWEKCHAVVKSSASLEEQLFGTIGRTGDRRPTFDLAARLAMARGARHLVETGSFRRWADGGSTFIWARLAAVLDGNLRSIDKDAARQNSAVHSIGEDLSRRTTFLNGDSVELLQGLAASGERIDLIYLDSLDVGPGDAHQLHQLAELKAAYPALAEMAIVILDDDNDDHGKGAMARPWLLKQGWKCIAREYQSVFVRQ